MTDLSGTGRYTEEPHPYDLDTDLPPFCRTCGFPKANWRHRMALTDMAGDTIAALPDDQLENAVRNQIMAALEEAGFVPSGLTSTPFDTVQRYQRGTREVSVAVQVMT